MTDQQQQEICSVASVGCPRETAAASVGVSVDQIEAEIQANPAFAARLHRAEAMIEITHMQNVRQASKEEKNWRASVWWLERSAAMDGVNNTPAQPERPSPSCKRSSAQSRPA
ncbi:MAG: hypothetical protein ACR2NU_11680 [Aeoliella sp.]